MKVTRLRSGLSKTTASCSNNKTFASAQAWLTASVRSTCATSVDFQSETNVINERTPRRELTENSNWTRKKFNQTRCHPIAANAFSWFKATSVRAKGCWQHLLEAQASVWLQRNLQIQIGSSQVQLTKIWHDHGTRRQTWINLGVCALIVSTYHSFVTKAVFSAKLQTSRWVG